MNKEMIAKHIKKHMAEKGITPYQVLKTGEINKQQLYAVLRMGNPSRPNYSIETLIKVLSLVGLKVVFKAKK